MKKLLAHIISFTSAVSLLLVSTTAQVFSAGRPMGDEYELNGLDPEKARYKPTITISQEVISHEEAKENPIRTVDVYIEGADAAYSSAGFTIKFDERLTLVKNKLGRIARAGDALEYCAPTFFSDTEHGFRTIIAASDNVGLDGKLFSFQVQLPEDINEDGETFPIEIYYNKDFDRFTNIDVDEDGQLMEAWLFTNGIEQGSISVKPKDPIDPSIGDTNNDGRIDSVDASRILLLFAFISTGGNTTEMMLAIFDINGDQKIDSIDASIVLTYYVFNSLNNYSSSFIDFIRDFGIRR